ncbi:MAG: phosphoribosylformylglycinamidine synthase I [Gammaproteobacteria bacterium]
MRIAIIQFPGSNCERETLLAVKRAGMEPVEFLWNEPKENLAEFAGYILVGGFSYEDRSRAGAIAALDPIMQVIKEQSEQGKPILGICNGAQILVEAGLVPGVENHKLALALTDNKRVQQGNVLGTGYYNAWVNMRLSDRYQYNAFTRCLTPETVLHIPVAHGEGRFVISPALLAEMQENGLNVFQYCDEQGKVIDEFPVNPNGSINNIAAISNKAGNVMAMMPHPERTEGCDAIFKSMREYIAEGYKQKVEPLHYYPRTLEIQTYQPRAHELVVDLVITDNQALSVETALKKLGIPVSIKRLVHWEVTCDNVDIFEKIKTSGVLYNDRKEIVLKAQQLKSAQVQKTLLVRAHEDMLGQQKTQMLKHHFGIEGVHEIRHGILWQIQAPENLINQVINSHILHNPYAHDCYYY